jgi:hypothetical protein
LISENILVLLVPSVTEVNFTVALGRLGLLKTPTALESPLN